MESICSCKHAISKSYVQVYRNKCPKCEQPLQPETMIDETLSSDLKQHYDVPRAIKTRQEGFMINGTSNSPHDPSIPIQTDRQETDCSQSITDNTISHYVITELGRILEEVDLTNKALARRPKPELPKFPAKDVTVDIFFLKLKSYIDIKNIVGRQAIHNLLVQCLQGEALQLYASIAEETQVDLPTLQKFLFRHFEPRKHEDIHTNELMTAEMKAGETISQYFLRIKELSRGLDINSQMQMYAFKQGLPCNFQKHLATKKIDTLQNLVDECITYEKIVTLGPSVEDRYHEHRKFETKILATLDTFSQRLARIEATGISPPDHRCRSKGNSPHDQYIEDLSLQAHNRRLDIVDDFNTRPSIVFHQREETDKEFFNGGLDHQEVEAYKREQYSIDRQRHKESQNNGFSAVIDGKYNKHAPHSVLLENNLANNLQPVGRTSKAWSKKDRRIRKHIKTADPQVVIFGDSIMTKLTRSFVTTSRPWKEAKIALSVIHGDRVENVLHRIKTTSFPNSVTCILTFLDFALELDTLLMTV